MSSLDISGDIDVDGTTNLDVVDIDGALTQDGGAVFNEASADVDFRVESDGNANMLFVDGGNNRVGVGTSSPTRPLDVNGSGIVRGFMTLYGTGTDNALFLHNTAYEWAAYTNASNYFVIEDWNLNQKRLVIDTSGNVGIGVAAPTMPLDIQSNSAASAIKIRGRSDDIAEVDFYNNANDSVMARFQVDTTLFCNLCWWLRTHED
jgi:prepilin-type processing-associated H-X9-DG protein